MDYAWRLFCFGMLVCLFGLNASLLICGGSVVTLVVCIMVVWNLLISVWCRVYCWLYLCYFVLFVWCCWLICAVVCWL